MSSIKWTPYAAADTAVAGAALNGLADGAYAWGPEIDNSTDLYTYAVLNLALSSAVTAASPASVFVFVVEPDGNGNYFASAGQPPASTCVASWTGVAGNVQYLTTPRFEVPPKFKVVLLNRLAVALPSTSTSTCTIRRHSQQVV